MKDYLNFCCRAVALTILSAIGWSLGGGAWAQSDDVTIIYYVAQEGAKSGEMEAAHSLAIDFFNDAETPMFFMPLGKKPSIIALETGIKQALDTLSTRDYTYPSINVPANLKKFQSSLNDFEKKTGTDYLDAQSVAIELHFIIEGSVYPQTIDDIQNRIIVLNGWGSPQGELQRNVSLYRWIWDNSNQRMHQTNHSGYDKN